MTDMTVGKPISHLWRYALPLLLGNLLQLGYNAVDSIIAGRFLGQNALAAEGIAAPIMNLVILAITGVTIGAGVLMSELFGAGDFPALRRTLATVLLFGGAASCVVALLCIALAPLFLSLMEVPAEIMDITRVYLRITFLGAPFTFFYNALAASLKSVGDSKTPLKFLAFSAILNAVLDLIFLGLLHFGIICSAVTTVVAEAVSALLAGGSVLRRFPDLTPTEREWTVDPALLKKVLGYGGPTALQQAVQPIGKVLIQGTVNSLGVSAIAAFNAVNRVDSFALIPEQGIASAISTFLAQNRGGGRQDRVRPGFRAGLRLVALYWVFIGLVVGLLRSPIVSLFVKGEGAAEVVARGSAYLLYMAGFYLLPGLTNAFQGFYRGMGKMYTTILGTFLQISLRVVFTRVLAPGMGLPGIAIASAIGWSCMLLFEIPYYFHTVRRQGLPSQEGQTAEGRAEP